MIIKKTFLLLILFSIFSCAYAFNPQVLLVMDTKNVSELPKKFRTTLDPIDKDLKSTGLPSLHLIGSRQFSEKTLQSVLKKLHYPHITIIDLRNESHGFINGNAVSWFGFRNAANEGKSPQQIRNIEENLLDNIKKASSVNIYEILSKEKGIILSAKLVPFKVYSVLTEAQLAQKYNLNYERFYVQDFHAPDNAMVDHFIQVVRRLPANEWLYIHCRAGVGRTTTFMAMADMMHNAKKVSFEDILARQKALGGKDFNTLPLPGEFKYSIAVARLNFLKKFYEYASSNKNNFATSWSEWLKYNSF